MAFRRSEGRYLSQELPVIKKTGIETITGEACLVSSSEPTSRHGRKRLDIHLFAWLSAAELLILVAVCVLYRAVGKPSFLSFLGSRPGVMFVVLILALVAVCVRLVWEIAVRHGMDSRVTVRTVAFNVVLCAGVLTAAEATLRMLAVEGARGPVLFGVELRPFVWSDVTKGFAEKWTEEQNLQFFLYDPLLGWTVAANRVGGYGLYQSSAEGIRSPNVGIRYTGTHPDCRIALVGDSFVFGEESEYEKSWGNQLARNLGAGCQVLNFGVPGYGIGQMYLRYQKDVAPFRPDVVIVGFTDAVFRTVGVYGMLTFAPDFMPWAIPRFILDKQDLKLLNVPLIPPEAIHSLKSIDDLPFVRHAWNYQPTEWERSGWRYASRSYLFKAYATLFPLWNESRPEVSGHELRAVNALLFSKLDNDIRKNGAVPLFVYLPEYRNYGEGEATHPLTVEILRAKQVAHVDLTDCLGRLPLERRFLRPDAHYTPDGELAVADCLAPLVRASLVRRRGISDGLHNATS